MVVSVPESNLDGRYQEGTMPLERGERHITVNGVRQWVRVAGPERQTPPLIIVHGGPGGNLWTFERTVGERLEADRPVVYWEQRGCGRSDLPARPDDYSIPLLVSDLYGVIQALGIERCSLLGFSFGAELALELTLTHPAHVDRLVLQCPSVGDRRRIAMVQLFGLLQSARGDTQRRIQQLIETDLPIEAATERAWSLVDSEAVDRLLFVSQEHARRNRRMWQESGLTNTGDMERALDRQESPAAPLHRRIAALSHPALVVVGLYDRNVGVEVARDVAATLPNARLEVFERSAHFPDIEETERYVASVNAFLDG